MGELRMPVIHKALGSILSTMKMIDDGWMDEWMDRLIDRQT
jgi:hypothetical protein